MQFIRTIDIFDVLFLSPEKTNLSLLELNQSSDWIFAEV